MCTVVYRAYPLRLGTRPLIGEGVRRVKPCWRLLVMAMLHVEAVSLASIFATGGHAFVV